MVGSQVNLQWWLFTVVLSPNSGTGASEPGEALYCQRLSQTLLPPRQRERAQGKYNPPTTKVQRFLMKTISVDIL